RPRDSPDATEIRRASFVNCLRAERWNDFTFSPGTPDRPPRSNLNTRTSTMGASGPPSWLLLGRIPVTTTDLPSWRAETAVIRSGPRRSGGSGGPFFPQPDANCSTRVTMRHGTRGHADARP